MTLIHPIVSDEKVSIVVRRELSYIYIQCILVTRCLSIDHERERRETRVIMYLTILLLPITITPVSSSLLTASLISIRDAVKSSLGRVTFHF